MLSRAVECCPTSVEVKVFLISQGVTNKLSIPVTLEDKEKHKKRTESNNE